jgi:glycosyltransferase involved in cell wall biosynthesis
MDGSSNRGGTLSVLMPVYNEARTLRTIVDRVLGTPYGMDLELVCVDDGSRDDSWEILQDLAREDPRIKAFQHERNRGKGAAIRSAIGYATGDVAIVQDSDLEYDPRDIPKVIGPILDGRADAVFGSRFASSPERRVLLFWHSVGNKVLTGLSNMVNDLNLTDMETCYKAVRLDLLKQLRLTSERFGIEPEITTRLAQYGARIYEVPISYDGRTYAEGKNIGWRDGVEAIWLIFKYRFLDTRHVMNTEFATRQSVGAAPRFRRWLIGELSPWLGERVLEVNAGPGHTTPHLLDRAKLTVTDPSPVHVNSLKRRFAHLENVDVARADFQSTDGVAELDGDFDTILCLDGLQRVTDPHAFVKALVDFAPQSSRIVFQVPSSPDLFGPTDQAAGHARRFTDAELIEIMESAGLENVSARRFNAVGEIGWQAHNSAGRTRITRLEATVFNLTVPVARRLDALWPDRGLSILASGEVP